MTEQISDIYKEACKRNVQFKTKVGTINVPDLWNISLTDLNELTMARAKQLREREELSFLKAPSKKDTEEELQFLILKSVIEDRLADKEALEHELWVKKRKEQLLSLMEGKKLDALKELPLEELEKELNKLG